MANSQKSDLKEIKDFLTSNFSDNIGDVLQLNCGERSKAFSFVSCGIKYVFRMNNHDNGFKKDEFAFKHFSEKVPIPKILKIGTFKDSFYSISGLCLGNPLIDGNKELPSVQVESIISAADQIHSVSVPKFTNFGVADINGAAVYKSWEKWIFKKNTVVTKDDGSFYSWEEVEKIPFVDEKTIKSLAVQIKKLVHFVPEERYLIHGDFGPGNIMINNDLVTGVIDWNEFGYGDFLFDIAWLDFWISKTNFSKAYKSHFQKKNQNIPFYEERLMCHKLFIGLNTLGIYATIDWEGGYKSTLDRINNLG
ncbi:MAG: aminoglycoside phosphotransferase family protein [Candidatus Shapirobacteria bacterium]|jgi:hygromycin-B 4-O-kinase